MNRVADGVLDVHLVLPRKLDNPRFRRVAKVDKVYVHHRLLEGDEDFDAELAAWVKASREEYGERKWLRDPRRASPSRGAAGTGK